MKKLFASVLLLLASLSAIAAVGDPDGYLWGTGSITGNGALDACTKYAALFPYTGVSVVVRSVGNADCYRSGSSNAFGSVQRLAQCAPGSGAYPNCAVPAALPADPNCPVGMHVYTWATPEDPSFPPQPICMPDGDPKTDIPSNIPDSQCSYHNVITNKCEAACPNGSYYGQVPTGAMACIKTSTGQVNNDNLPSDCPRGYMNISATSEPNCAPVSPTSAGQPTRPPGSAGETTKPTPDTSSNTTGPTVTIGNPDGGTTETTPTTVTNRDGSTTTTTTTKTTAADGTVSESTTSTTSNTPGGAVGKSDAQADDKNDLCIRHPELSMCKVSAVTQADCAATVCTGDAIQCALLRQSIKASCDAKADADALKSDAAYSLGSAVASGNDPLASTLPSASNGSTVTMPSSLDSSGWLGGGACFPDKQFSLQGHSITISFTSACQPLLVFRYALMIVALLLSFRMLSGVIFRS